MAKIHTVTPKKIIKWLEAGEAILIDVREPAEHNSMSIEHARNLPLSKVNIDDAHLPEHKHKKLVIHCQSGKRSMMACEKLADAPFDIWNLEGGILAWKDTGLPVKSSASKHMPLDRQVQLTIGMTTFIGVALGYCISPTWLILPAITGLGLINAGLTGWCELATVIAMMPWSQK